MRWERDPSGALIPERDRFVVPAGAIAGLAERLRFGESLEELRPYGLLPSIAGGADAHAAFAYSTVLTPPSPAASGPSLVVQSGDGAHFPATTPYNCVVCPAGQRPTPANAEIVRVTARATDTFTITRAQEGTSARTILAGDQFFNAPTPKTFTDIEPSTAWTQFSSDVNTAPATAVVVANTLYYNAINVPYACTLTGIRLGLTTAAAGNVVVALYDSTGTRVAASASTVVVNLNYMHVPFSAVYAASSGLYYVAVVYSSATTSVYQASPMAQSGSTAQGSFIAPASITVPAANAQLVTTPRMGTY